MVITLCTTILAILAWGFITVQVLGQPIKDPTERIATVEAKVEEMMRRQDKIDTTNQYVLIGLFGNLVAHILQVKVTRDSKERRRILE